MSNFQRPLDNVSRRTFLKASGMTTLGLTAGLTTGLATPSALAKFGGSDTLKVGLIGCGGRGTGAARDAVVSSENVEITAMGDLFEDRLDQSRASLLEEIGESLKVSDETAFIGFDAYEKVLDTDVDMVILATPPGFRPIHFRAAIVADKHVFMEKPVSVDVVGALNIMDTGRMATEKGLSVVAGTLYRRQNSFVEGVKRIHDGMIGEIVGAQEYYMTGPIWLRKRKPGMSDMEWQTRNWYYFTWLSGDHIVEQFVHNLDVINWVMQDHPESALGMGGRISRVDPSYGHIYDHFSVEYEYANGVKVEAKSRQIAESTTRNTNRIIGTKGVADLHPGSTQIRSHDGEILYDHPERGNNGYVQEHADLIASIRKGPPINEAQQIAESTLTAVIGRESAYTGQAITWGELLAANNDLVPRKFEFGDMPVPAVAEPGRTILNRAPWAPKNVTSDLLKVKQ
ncbi:MAG: Gfo/Idh/MocA family oxidoreductase [Rhodothermia bacterium]|nr:MAG: Gfo/Idh/MocA family oxidoreductase [Rhodothermia bacterium]